MIIRERVRILLDGRSARMLGVGILGEGAPSNPSVFCEAGWRTERTGLGLAAAAGQQRAAKSGQRWLQFFLAELS